MNYNGEDVELAQHNMDIAVPYLLSTRGYGILWDNNSITRVGDPKPYAMLHNRRGLAGRDILRRGQAGREPRRGRRSTIQYIRDLKRWPARSARREDDESRLERHHIPLKSREFTSSDCIPQVMLRFMPTEQKCSSAGGKTGIPGTTTSSCR